MTLSMFEAAVPPLARSLTNLSGILAKAAAHAEARGIDQAVLLQARLYPDMFPLVRQVQIATDIARRGLARLAGVESTAMADDESSFADLIGRIETTLTSLAAFSSDQIDGTETRAIELPIRGETLHFSGQSFLLFFVLPNVYFHVTTAYDILRHNGVELGKRDFLGEP
ncbi:hypothetical protein L107_14017 [Cyanobium sp. Copco_Reservoir_LC18]|jgi:hypothetical protein|uniref:DUF1993 domain-containing protein n=1 Tax=Cyanobium sp. Copco_Reservoir_LC18 TaxID=1328305 RepID=UPI0013580D12|nr:DUF1993 domain-containing protein [Cyanobium sp. Copco_Reservoir_LC18]KAF0652015.1 hypothetical protein L107_14017 [Cyanobium sp. Copco_Reservoir_LC18]